MKMIAKLIGMVALAGPAYADAPPPAAVIAALQPVQRLIVRGADLPTFTVYEWERDGVHHNAWPGDATPPPPDAARIELKLYTFPTGQLRKLYFGPGQRTPPHLNMDDIILYSLGTRQLEVADGDQFIAHPGDATLHPAGVSHYSQTITPGWRCEFAFKAQGRSGLDAVALSGQDRAVHDATERVEGGRRVVTYGDAGTIGAHFAVRMYQFPGYQLIEQRLPKGETLPDNDPAEERLLYVVSGSLSVRSGEEQSVVGPGDMIRVSPGHRFARTALADSVVLDVSGSKAP
jgi:quercetin dioxygenase-like cupin family protein